MWDPCKSYRARTDKRTKHQKQYTNVRTFAVNEFIGWPTEGGVSDTTLDHSTSAILSFRDRIMDTERCVKRDCDLCAFVVGQGSCIRRGRSQTERLHSVVLLDLLVPN